MTGVSDVGNPCTYEQKIVKKELNQFAASRSGSDDRSLFFLPSNQEEDSGKGGGKVEVPFKKKGYNLPKVCPGRSSCHTLC